MDIVSRLKQYMETENIASSQFADRCGIPRPTISQILNGRNKKISDELIAKIHTAYPALSIMWLMFGEGPMAIDANIKISEPQIAPKLDFSDSYPFEQEQFATPESAEKTVKENRPENFNRHLGSFFGAVQGQNGRDSNLGDTIAHAIESKTDVNRKITSIVVFYADSTFQTFTPTV